MTKTNPHWTLLQIIVWQATSDIGLVGSLRKGNPSSKSLAATLGALGVLDEIPEDIDEVCIGGPPQEIIKAHMRGRITLVAGNGFRRVSRAALSNASICFRYQCGLYIRTNPTNPSAGIAAMFDDGSRRGAFQISGYKPTADPIRGEPVKLDNHAWLGAFPRQAPKETITVRRPEWHNICALAREVQLAFPGGAGLDVQTHL